jgi:hypothetical protein
VTLTRLNRLVMAIQRTNAASPFSSKCRSASSQISSGTASAWSVRRVIASAPTSSLPNPRGPASNNKLSRYRHQNREHADLDVLVLRRDQALIRQELRDWDVHATDPPRRLQPWSMGETLPPTVHDVCCRRAPRSPWVLQLMIDDTDGDDWLFRRDFRNLYVLHGHRAVALVVGFTSVERRARACLPRRR